MAEPDIPAFRWELLQQLQCEDRLLLLHVWWEASGHVIEGRLSESLAVAEDLVFDLVARGYVELGPLSGDPVNPEFDPVPARELPDRLKQYDSWFGGSGGEQLWLGITDEGTRALSGATDQRVL